MMVKGYLSEGRGRGRCFQPQMLLKVQSRRNKSREPYDIRQESGFRQVEENERRNAGEHAEILELRTGMMSLKGVWQETGSQRKE